MHLTEAVPHQEKIRTWAGASWAPERATEVGVPLAAPVADDRVTDWMALCTDLDEVDAQTERLDLLGLDRDVLRRILVTPAELAAAGLVEPPWVADFAEWHRRSRASRPTVRLDGSAGLLALALPLIEGAADELAGVVIGRLSAATGGEETLADPQRLVPVVVGALPVDAVGEAMMRTLVLELNVARVEGRLVGDTPVERFSSFTVSLADPKVAQDLWDEYPVMARVVCERLRHWIDARLELVDRLMTDLPVLRASGLVGATWELRAIEVGAGDGHRRGRSVAIVVFDRGRIVYKPRSLAIDLAYDRLLQWTNETVLRPGLRRLRTVDRGSYGWVEHVDVDAVTDEAGADRYAHRLGVLSALLHALNATDFHLENVLAEGDCPILVDLEALVHVELPTDRRSDDLDGPAAGALRSSVYGTGLLPQKLLIRGDGETHAWDFSAIGGQGGQLSPFAVGGWDAQATDLMRYAPQRVEMGAEHNRPRSRDGDFDLTARSAAYDRGFTATYRLLVERRDELLAPDGPLAGFRNAEGRQIVRATNIYARLLVDATHPDFLRDGMDRDRCLSRICAGLRTSPYRRAILANELAELRRGDIPVFTVHLGTGELRGGDRDQLIATLPRVPMDVVGDRISALDEADLAFQRRIAAAAFATAALGADRARWSTWSRPRAPRAPESDTLAAGALQVARRLADTAVRDGDRVGWIGLQLVDEKHWVLGATSFDLFNGAAGIALGLDATAAVTGDPVVDDLTLAVCAALQRVIHRLSGEDDARPAGDSVDIGVMGPIGGPLYALAHVAARRQRPDLARAAALLVPVIGESIEADRNLDLVAGSAGAILALLALERVLPGCGALDVADRCADHLLARRQERDGGWAWVSAVDPTPLSGLSHGASGVALALSRLHAERPRPELDEAVRGALAFERSTFDGEAGNWRDLRSINESGDATMATWCHGAGGIALVRTELGAEDERRRAVAYLAGDGLLADPVVGSNHSLCHGALGNLLILDTAVRPAAEPGIAAALPGAWVAALESGTADGWLCGVPQGLETPGLMTGLAGISWALARKARPDLVPDLLTLEPPTLVD